MIHPVFIDPVLTGIILAGMLFCCAPELRHYADEPYLQDYAEKYQFRVDEPGTELISVSCDRNKSIRVLSSGGLLHPWEKALEKDLLYRPLSDMNIVAVRVHHGQLVYLTDRAVLSNAWAGKFFIPHDVANVTRFAMGEDFSVLLAARGKLAFFRDSGPVWERAMEDFIPLDIVFDQQRVHFIILTENSIYTFRPVDRQAESRYEGEDLTCLALASDDREILVGTKDGIFSLDAETFQSGTPLNRKLPATGITCISEINGQPWFGTSRGAFKGREDGRYDYYASKRWLVDDHVIDISDGPGNDVLVLTRNGLSILRFEEMTLDRKAAYFQEVQRLRHIRYGFSSESHLKVPGDLSTSVLRDSDNDGLWTSMYLAGELFRYAVTKSDDALQNAYEAFEAMERLTEITGLEGFPARTYEIDGYQSSDTDPDIPEDQKIWRLTGDGRWRWKSTTSSDESCGHFFVYPLFAEIVPDREWRDRAIHQIRIEMDHIIDHDWYLVTWNGEITRWGRWNPEYVNSFSIHVGDRRLNSTLILAFLQAAYHFTGEERYREKAYELMDDHGYKDNVTRPASVIGFVQGQPLSDAWNHSDDEMYFLTAPALIKYAFTGELRKEYFDAVRSHWEIERSEKNPLWNFIYLLIGGEDYDLEESIWWLREFPMDLVSWNVDNSHRKDLTRVEPNFRKQEYTEVLPRDERPMHLHNNAYRNNGGSGGMREYPPYIYLLPYWAGRYTGAIGPPKE